VHCCGELNKNTLTDPPNEEALVHDVVFW
jgi:hypothetical protein